MKVLLATVVALAGLSLTPATAHATQSEFLQRVSQELPYVYAERTSDQLVAEGMKVCGLEAAQTEEYDETTQVASDLSISRDAAIKIEVLSTEYLGC